MDYMEYLEFLNGDIVYVIEINFEDQLLYIYSRNTAVHFPDLAKKFVYKRSASRFFKTSWYAKNNCPHRVLKYSREKDEFINK